MSFSSSLLIALNKMFPLPVHPFNLANDGKMSYTEWQFRKGDQTIQFFLPFHSQEEMFKNKTVLDIGCGGGGKTCYYATFGPEKIIGIDIVPHYAEEGNAFAREKGLDHIASFMTGDASKMLFEDETFDTIIMNDAMEHVDNPEKTLEECFRVLKKGGHLYINFPPYYHPYGAHLSDAIGFPWVHSFFSEQTLIDAYRKLVQDLPDGKDRLGFRISKRPDGSEYFSYINHMTIRRFRNIQKGVHYPAVYQKEIPLRNVVANLAKTSLFREYFVKMVVCVYQKK
ncbi:class I SAM-dependent methyltransferase [Brevibacillus laterosporus]|uniref:Demethylrebeccamycin-D-glucose O-methyltransferase n=1 Tax=Brevibacillus laterosporus LMG 15441 TaxID=1042163 RepID=A0A075R2Q9_BRELA|nr:class I SAM-dependent methyltransferase [Brevibacillus laterosporus]HAS00939.1 class I SAM-dependent methyltransferase [Brevibacillus sp.]AIG25493.1 demethylrebeccamycin-D-glucose O-methyltransferase [Brevibacillus laterosporus LMG 15441]AYK07038.1 class I SAM-dependent methyltransferase [Brevibacillus laterosporus]MDF9411127.1 class I SAM-dependent methyltransferase [Brevibacillus laterosporus]RJL08723.1 class I SAM-dependent methyltransferase [Brevibacillus laterosporus]